VAVLAAGTRLRDAAWAFDEHRARLAGIGMRGTLVLVCELAGQELDVVERAINSWLGL
jgi:hypothetical protein